MEEKEKKWVTIYKITNDLDGERLEAILKENDIPVYFHRLQMIPGSFQPATGKGELFVEEGYAEEAKKIIADFEKNIDKSSPK